MQKPQSLDPLAEAILTRLAKYPAAAEIVLGGDFALQHYVDYRRTHDIDAGWKDRASKDTEEAIREVMSEVAAELGYELKTRVFGETLSFDFHRGKPRDFSFQISLQTITLQTPLLSSWPPVLIETLEENVAAKMNALVNRGAARDLLDIKQVVDRHLVSAARCWELWTLKNPDQEVNTAKQKVLLHVAVLEAKRPLQSIRDLNGRTAAHSTREWIKSFAQE